MQSLLHVDFDGAIDASSVTRGHVTLVTQGAPVPTTVAYDDTTHVVTVTPMGLQYGTTYTLTVAGLSDAAGQPVSSRQIRFSTWVNPIPDSHTTLDDSGREIQYIDPQGFFAVATRRTSDGLPLEAQTWDDPGPDLAWFTADDHRQLVTSLTYAVDGALTQIDRVYVGQAVESTSRTTFTQGPTGLDMLETTSQVGPDRTLGTADDLVSTRALTYDSSDRLATTLSSGGYDADGQVQSANVITGFEEYGYGSNGRLSRVDRFKAVGPDGLPFTADDVLASYSTFTYDERGNVISSAYYSDDVGTLDTGLVLQNLSVSTFGADNNRIRRVDFFGPGPAGEWRTADDLVGGTYDYDTTR